jgi:pimeloyl-ACP methyl ester carboxylesterase
VKLEVFHCQPTAKKGATHAPILFVHGSYCAAWMWAERYMPYFAEQGFPTHAISLRGHGGSEGVLTWASLDDYIDDVESAVAQIEGEPILIGHSMGGLVIQHYLSRRQPAKAAVLLASVPPSGLGSSAMHLSLFSPDVLWQLGLLQSLGADAVSAEVIHRAFFTAATSAETVAHLLPKLQCESHRISAELLAPSQPHPPEIVGKPPILVMGGDADVFLPTSAFRETATFFKADLEILHGAPHGLMLDEAWWKPSADKIIEWLAKKKL